MHDISGPPEVRDDRYGAAGESLTDRACAEVADRRKHERISGA
jgi:hypothetical protein